MEMIKPLLKTLLDLALLSLGVMTLYWVGLTDRPERLDFVSVFAIFAIYKIYDGGTK